MVIAESGMGKTYFLLQESLELATKQIKYLDTNFSSSIDEINIPIFLGSDELIFLAKGYDDFVESILLLIKSHFAKHWEFLHDSIEKKIIEGKCTLFLDAIDKVPIELVDSLSDKINLFQKEYRCRVFCSTRPSGCQDNFLYNSKVLYITPFNYFQIKNYIFEWISQNEAAIQWLHSPSKILRILRNDPESYGFFQNPLFLSLLCPIFNEDEKNHLKNRAEIYKNIVKLILGKRKKGSVHEVRVEVKIMYLEELSYYFSKSKKNQFDLKDDLLKRTVIILDTYNQLSNHFDAEKLITELIETDGILVATDPENNKYEFLHHTFQEFFTASYLKRKFDENNENCFEMIRRYYSDFDWHQTIVLLAGLMKENPIPLIENIIDTDRLSLNELILATNKLLLAGNCIVESNCNLEPLFSKIADKIYTVWRFSKYDDKRLISVLASLMKKSNIIIIKVHSDLRRSDSIEIQKSCIEILGRSKCTDSIPILSDFARKGKEPIKSLSKQALEEIYGSNFMIGGKGLAAGRRLGLYSEKEVKRILKHYTL